MGRGTDKIKRMVQEKITNIGKKVGNFIITIKKAIFNYKKKEREKRLYKSDPTQWREVLERIYVNDLNARFLNTKKYREKKLTKESILECTELIPLAKYLVITNEDIYNALKFLEEMELIKHEPPLASDYKCVLTAKGFEVALKNEKHKDNISMNKLLISATALLSIFTVLNALLSQNIISNDQFIIISIITIVIIGIWAVNR